MRYIVIAAIFFSLTACHKKPTQDYSNCAFSYQAAATELKWTAYKFTEKTGVSGKLKTFSLTGSQTSREIVDIFAGAEFSADGMSVDSSNPERDGKLKEHFFANLANKGKISGRFIKAQPLSVELVLNGVSQVIPVAIFQKSPLEYTAKLSLDLNKFNAQAAVKKLNQICHELHIGKDGISKLWPDVDVEIHTTLKPECGN